MGMIRAALLERCQVAKSLVRMLIIVGILVMLAGHTVVGALVLMIGMTGCGVLVSNSLHNAGHSKYYGWVIIFGCTAVLVMVLMKLIALIH